MQTYDLRLLVNGRTHDVRLPSNVTLLQTLRDLGYTDVKNGCEIGECGACAVLLDGQPVNSCMVLTVQADGATITTNAGLGTVNEPHVIQEAFADAGAVQCGFCTSGMVIATKALLDMNADPSEEEIRNALSGNLCRCTGYGQIISAVRLAAERLRDLPLCAASSRSEDASSLREEGREPDSSNRLLVSDGNAPSQDDTTRGGE
ncbi:(2Fe-2S)-binding protein [Candidatus Bipolaricaulota bacterium]